MEMAMAVVTAVVFGFLAGLLSFRAKGRWCPECGTTLICPEALSGTGHHRRRDHSEEGSWTGSN
jgi:hypothetical protein